MWLQLKRLKLVVTNSNTCWTILIFFFYLALIFVVSLWPSSHHRTMIVLPPRSVPVFFFCGGGEEDSFEHLINMRQVSFLYLRLLFYLHSAGLLFIFLRWILTGIDYIENEKKHYPLSAKKYGIQFLVVLLLLELIFMFGNWIISRYLWVGACCAVCGDTYEGILGLHSLGFSLA